MEKIGIGIDIVEITRFKKISYENNQSFYKKFFSASEIEYCLKFSDPYKHFTGKFAIKEAVKKSISEKIDLPNIITDHYNSKPTVKIIDNEEYSFLVSLSHESKMVVAIVISEKIV